MFDKATRMKLRFDSPRGLLSVEDLWDLPLTHERPSVPNLDDVAKVVHRELRNSAETTSFVTPAAPANDELQLKLEVVKHIIGVRIEERDVAANAAKKREQKQKIFALIEEKKDEALRGKSVEELQQMVEAL